MNRQKLLQFKSLVTWTIVILLITGGLYALISCKVFRSLKKDKDDRKFNKEQPALYGPPPSRFKE